MRTIIYLLFFILTNSACDSSVNIEQKDILNTIWILNSLNEEGNSIPIPDNQLYSVQFNDDSTVGGKNDCNDFYADYLISQDSLFIYQLVSTKKGCNGDQAFSNKYIEALNITKSLKIKNDNLYVYYGNNSELIFK